MKYKQRLCAAFAAALMVFSSAALAADTEELPPPEDPAVEESATPPAGTPDTEETVPPETDGETPDPDETPDGGNEADPDEGAAPDGEADPDEGEAPDGETNPDEGEIPDGEADPDEAETPGADSDGDEEAEPDKSGTPGGNGIETELGSTIVTESPEDEAAPAVEDDGKIIRVEVQTGNLIVNPYGLTVIVDGKESTERVASDTMVLTNYSRAPVQVNVSVYGTVSAGSEAVFVEAPPAEDAPDKELFVYLEFRNSADGSIPESWLSEYANASNQLLVTPEGRNKEGVLYLGAADEEYLPTYGLFRMFGAAAVSPAETWTKADRTEINIAFTFTALN